MGEFGFFTGIPHSLGNGFTETSTYVRRILGLVEMSIELGPLVLRSSRVLKNSDGVENTILKLPFSGRKLV